MYIGTKGWRRKEWISSILIFFVLKLHLLFVGYPIIYPDSSRYLNAAFFLKTGARSPLLVSHLIRPLVILLGAWGFVIFQIVMLTYVLVSILKFFDKNFRIGIISIIMSAAGFMATAVMMDIYTAIGLLALFLILNGSKDAVLYIILSLCFVAHYGNVYLFPICAFFYWLIFSRKSIAILILLLIIFIIPLFISCAVNYKLERSFRFLPKEKYTVVVASIIADSPEITEAYIKQYPESLLTKNRQVHKLVTSRKHSGRKLQNLVFIFKGQGGIFHKIGIRKKFNSEAKRFILYALKNHSSTLLRKGIYKTYRFLERPKYGGAFVRPKGILVADVKRFMPHQMNQARKSLQYRNNLSAINFKFFYKLCYYTSLLVILAFLILSIYFTKLRKTRYFSFVVFVAIVIVFNAFAMQSRGAHGRLLVRTLLLPCLATCLVISDFYLWRKKKIKVYFKGHS